MKTNDKRNKIPGKGAWELPRIRLGGTWRSHHWLYITSPGACSYFRAQDASPAESEVWAARCSLGAHVQGAAMPCSRPALPMCLSPPKKQWMCPLITLAGNPWCFQSSTSEKSFGCLFFPPSRLDLWVLLLSLFYLHASKSAVRSQKSAFSVCRLPDGRNWGAKNTDEKQQKGMAWRSIIYLFLSVRSSVFEAITDLLHSSFSFKLFCLDSSMR